MHGNDALDIGCSYALPPELISTFGRKPVLYLLAPGAQPTATERKQRDDAVYLDSVEQEKTRAAAVAAHRQSVRELAGFKNP